MAKKKSKKKGLVPKRIAGAKVPKRLRRDLNGVLSSPMGRTLLADAVVAAGAAVMGVQSKKGSKTRSFLNDHPPSQAPHDAAAAASSASSALAFAIGEASRSFVDALHRGKAMADARAAWPEADEEPAPSKKKPGAAPDTSPAH